MCVKSKPCHKVGVWWLVLDGLDLCSRNWLWDHRMSLCWQSNSLSYCDKNVWTRYHIPFTVWALVANLLLKTVFSPTLEFPEEICLRLLCECSAIPAWVSHRWSFSKWTRRLPLWHFKNLREENVYVHMYQIAVQIIQSSWRRQCRFSRGYLLLIPQGYCRTSMLMLGITELLRREWLGGAASWIWRTWVKWYYTSVQAIDCQSQTLCLNTRLLMVPNASFRWGEGRWCWTRKLNTLGYYSRVMLKRECDIDKWIRAAASSDKALSFPSIYIPALTYGHEL